MQPSISADSANHVPEPGPGRPTAGKQPIASCVHGAGGKVSCVTDHSDLRPPSIASAPTTLMVRHKKSVTRNDRDSDCRCERLPICRGMRSTPWPSLILAACQMPTVGWEEVSRRLLKERRDHHDIASKRTGPFLLGAQKRFPGAGRDIPNGAKATGRRPTLCFFRRLEGTFRQAVKIPAELSTSRQGGSILLLSGASTEGRRGPGGMEEPGKLRERRRAYVTEGICKPCIGISLKGDSIPVRRVEVGRLP